MYLYSEITRYPLVHVCHSLVKKLQDLRILKNYLEPMIAAQSISLVWFVNSVTEGVAHS